ncbi:MAG: DinB family protein [Candidatus Krumholzibacteria bacterium]|nr:DinB family protein [Candidatus Krumholzibacteria bacterium]
MTPAMQTALNTLRFDNKLFLELVATLDDDTAHRRIADDVNPVIWIAGHLLNSRRYLLGLFGVESALPFEEQLKAKYNATADYPSMSDIKSAWIDISDALFRQMEQASEDQYTKKIDWNLPNGDKTVRGAVLFFTYHEAWHLGQIAYARKAMGMDGLVPY